MRKNITIAFVTIASLALAFILMKNKAANEEKSASLPKKMPVFL
jgi:hypothetical protein